MNHKHFYEILLFGIVGILILSCSTEKDNHNVRELLSEQMKYSHTEENWFVPTKIAITGISAEQSKWKDSTENHSIGELVSHLLFWNELFLKNLNGQDFSDLEMDNELTFKVYSENGWENTVAKLDSVQMKLQLVIERASNEQLSDIASDVLTMTAHNAYHTGQIMYIRKRNGWWK